MGIILRKGVRMIESKNAGILNCKVYDLNVRQRKLGLGLRL